MPPGRGSARLCRSLNRESYDGGCVNEPIRFGSVEIRPSERQLLLAGRPAALGARAFDVLLALIARRGQVISKSELLDLVWPGLVVEENNLQVHVSALRKLLGPHAIATIPGRGYRFTAPLNDAATPAKRVDERESASAAQAQGGVSNASGGNLPRHSARLYGREADLAAVLTLLDAHPVVSIIGAGGIGKTSLGLAVAAAAAAADERFADGAWWIELAALQDAALLPTTIAGALGLQIASGRPPLEALCAVLSDQRLLLVLDNCEQLAGGVADLVDAVRARARGVRILVTSQEPLRAAEEQLYRLDTLELPTAASVDAAAASGAVALFAARARAADPRFQLGSDNVEDVVEICRRLDGIPLALELAAARVPLLGVKGLRAKLNERLNVLTGGARMRLRRHQTLRAALEWSCGLLSADEQTVLRRLGVFAGGFTLDLAQQVVTDQRIDQWSALDALGHLVDKSLVVVEGDAEPRYRLLETTRAYALELLAAAGETRQWLQRHAEAMSTMLEAVHSARWDAKPVPEGARIARELDNVRAALSWSAGDDGDRGLAIDLHATSMELWRSVVLTWEGLDRCRTVAPWVDDRIPKANAARFWLTVAWLGMLSERTECFDAAARAAELFGQLGDRRGAFEAFAARAAIAARRADQSAAAAALDAARALVEPAWPAERRSLLAFASWISALWFSGPAEAVKHAWQQVALRREAGNEYGEVIALGNVGAAEILIAGQEATGEARLRDAATRLEALGMQAADGHIRWNLTAALVLRGALDEALRQARLAYRSLRREGDQKLMLGLLPLLAARLGHIEAAARFAGYAAAAPDAGGIRRGRWNKQAVALLQQALPADRYEELMAEGARLNEEDAFALVLDPHSSARTPSNAGA